MLDLLNNTALVQSLRPAARIATANGASADLQNHRSAVITIDSGLWTDGTHTFSLQESDDNSSWSNVAAADLNGTLPVIDGATDDDQAYSAAYMGEKRYIRVVQTVAAAVTGLVSSATINRGHPRYAGSNPATV